MQFDVMIMKIPHYHDHSAFINYSIIIIIHLSLSEMEMEDDTYHSSMIIRGIGQHNHDTCSW